MPSTENADDALAPELHVPTMIHYVFPLCWAVILTFSLLGWGRALRVALKASRFCPPGADISLGLAAAVVVGGWLNLTALALRPAAWGFVALGALLGVGQVKPLLSWIGSALGAEGPLIQRRLRTGYLALLVLILVITVFASVRAGSTPGNSTVTRFNPHDDFHAYLVFPERMLQTGSMGSDPFNERRLNTGLGGQSFLLALAKAGMPFESLHLLEPGIGTLAALLTLLALCSALGLKWGSAIALTLLAAAYPMRTANLSAFATGIALLLCLVLQLGEWPSDKRNWRMMVLAGLTAGAVCALKTTFLVPVVGFVGLFFVLRLCSAGSRFGVLGEAMGVGLVALVTLAPWMISLYRSSGTLLFPLLGSGFIDEVKPSYALLPMRSVVHFVLETLSDPPAVGLAVTGGALLWSGLLRTMWGQMAFALCGGVWGWLAVAAGSFAGADTIRYAQGSFSCALVVGVAVLLAKRGHAGKVFGMDAPLAFGVAGAALVVGAIWRDTRSISVDYGRAILATWTAESFDVPAYRNRYAAMQGTIEREASILVRLERPFLLDFREQKIFVVDWPGGASLPPGMPLSRGPDALADYLLHVGIPYLAYDYAHEAGFPRQTLDGRTKPGQNAWVRSQAQNTFAFQDLLAALGARYVRVYDDGELWAIDLRRPLAEGDHSKSR